MGASTFSRMLRKAPNYILKFKTPTSLMGAAKTMCHAPLCSIVTLLILSIQLGVMFRLVATLCENGGTLDVMVRSEDTFVPHAIPHLVSKVNRSEVTKVQLEPWHAFVATLHDLPTWPTIDRITNVIPRVMVMHDEERMF
jgi:hypothetical protein